jgi:hypothetical protein
LVSLEVSKTMSVVESVPQASSAMPNTQANALNRTENRLLKVNGHSRQCLHEMCAPLNFWPCVFCLMCWR